MAAKRVIVSKASTGDDLVLHLMINPMTSIDMRVDLTHVLTAMLPKAVRNVVRRYEAGLEVAAVSGQPVTLTTVVNGKCVKREYEVQ